MIYLLQKLFVWLGWFYGNRCFGIDVQRFKLLFFLFEIVDGRNEFSSFQFFICNFVKNSIEVTLFTGIVEEFCSLRVKVFYVLYWLFVLSFKIGHKIANWNYFLGYLAHYLFFWTIALCVGFTLCAFAGSMLVFFPKRK